MTNWTFHVPGNAPATQPAQTRQSVTTSPSTTMTQPPATPRQRPASVTPVSALPQRSTNGSALASQRQPVSAPRPEPTQHVLPGFSTTSDQTERLGEVLGIMGRYNGGLDLSKGELETLETQVGNMLIEVYETHGGFNDQTIRHIIGYIQPYTKPWEHVRHLLTLMESNPETREELLNCWLYGVLKYGLVPLMQAASTLSLVVSVVY